MKNDKNVKTQASRTKPLATPQALKTPTKTINKDCRSHHGGVSFQDERMEYDDDDVVSLSGGLDGSSAKHVTTRAFQQVLLEGF